MCVVGRNVSAAQRASRNLFCRPHLPQCGQGVVLGQNHSALVCSLVKKMGTGSRCLPLAAFATGCEAARRAAFYQEEGRRGRNHWKAAQQMIALWAPSGRRVILVIVSRHDEGGVGDEELQAPRQAWDALRRGRR